MVYQIHFKQTWRKEIKDQLTRIDSMWTSDYISWRALQVSNIKKILSKNKETWIISFKSSSIFHVNKYFYKYLKEKPNSPVKSMIIYK